MLYSQYATAIDHLKLIASAPELMKSADAKIKEGKPECLLEAHKMYAHCIARKELHHFGHLFLDITVTVLSCVRDCVLLCRLMELCACRDGLLYQLDQNTREAASHQAAAIDQSEQLEVRTLTLRNVVIDCTMHVHYKYS